jgi:hypothetical protein
MLARWLTVSFLLRSGLPAPLPMAPQFSVNFSETYSGYPIPPSTGAWYYDFARLRWLAVHNGPQGNNFCSCASNTTASCNLLFTTEGRGGMYVDFPSSPSSCCRLCGEEDGCTVLRPDWLSANSTDAGLDDLGCERWCRTGDEASADCLSYPAAGGRVPCQYFEFYNFSSTIVVHNLTFIRESYRENIISDSVFALRDECAKDCPKLFPAQCG